MGCENVKLFLRKPLVQTLTETSASAVYLLPQIPGASKRNQSPRIQNQIIPCCWISPPALIFFFDKKLPKSADQDILTVLQGVFDCF